MSPTTTQNMPLKVKIITPPPSTTNTEKRMFPSPMSKELLVDTCCEVLVVALVVVEAIMKLVVVEAIIIMVGSVAVVVILHSSP